MSRNQHAPSARRRTRPVLRAVLVSLLVSVLVAATGVGLAVSGVLGHRSPTASTEAAEPVASGPSTRLPHDGRQQARRPALGPADGVVPDGTTVFDDVPAVTNLDPDLLDTLRRAATDAADDGVEFYVNSGWRSPAYQEHLLDEAIATYGSRAEAARWVATPTTSPHVSGDAVDIGHAEADAWLARHGATYGLCQIYDNEPWHYELRPEAVEHGCPARYADPTADPRMQQ